MLEFLTLLAVVIYARYAALQWREMRTLNGLTKQDFHITQQAYVTAVRPTLDAGSIKDVGHIILPTVTIFLANSGRQVSGPISTVIHEAVSEQRIAVFDQPAENALQGKIDAASEHHCEQIKSSPLAPNGSPDPLVVHIPHLEVGKYYEFGKTIIIAGRITFGDGFIEDAPQHQSFCFYATYPHARDEAELWWATCDPSMVLPQLETKDAKDPNCQQHQMSWGYEW